MPIRRTTTMPISSRLLLIFLVPLALCLLAAPAQAQVPQGEKPVMQNIFFNVFWGSAAGALLGAAAASTASSSKESPDKLRDTVIQGATLGGIAGLAAGVWLIFNGITFNPDRSLLFGGALPLADSGQRPPLFEPPIVFLAEKKNPLRITGLKARIFAIRF